MGLFENISSLFNRRESETPVKDEDVRKNDSHGKNGNEMTTEDYQKKVDAYFAEYGIDPAQVIVEQKTVLARSLEKDIWRIRKINGRPAPAATALPLGEATPDGLIIMKQYVPDEAMGEEAVVFKKYLDDLNSTAKVNNVIWHEGRHVVDLTKVGDRLYDVTPSQFLELKHDQEKSAYRESAFRELLEYKRTGDPKYVTADNNFLLESDMIDFNSDKLSEQEIRLVAEGIDRMYAETKQGIYEKKYCDSLWLDWSVKRKVKDKTDFDDSAYKEIKNIYNTYEINGQKIDVSAYTQATPVNALMYHMVTTKKDQIQFTDAELKQYGKVPEAEICQDDIGTTPVTSIGVPHTEIPIVILADMEHSYNKYEEAVFSAYMFQAFQYEYKAEGCLTNFLEEQKRQRKHNADAEMRQTDLPGFLALNKAYQTAFARKGIIGDREESLREMRNCETWNLTLELLNAYGNGQQDQLRKIMPDLPEIIARECPSLVKENGQINKNMPLSEVRKLQQQVDICLDKIAPSFEKEAEAFYDQNYAGQYQQSQEKMVENIVEPATVERTEIENGSSRETKTEEKAKVHMPEALAQPTDSVQKVAEDMKRGHDRIAAMRAKVAAGHEAERKAMYAEFLEHHDNTEAIRRLRSSKTISSGIVRPTSIRADLLQKQLQEFQTRP